MGIARNGKIHAWIVRCKRSLGTRLKSWKFILTDARRDLRSPQFSAFNKLASMAAAAIRLNPAAARGKIIYYAKESAPVIRPIAITGGNTDRRRLRTFRHSLAGGQDDAARRDLAADRIDLRAEVIQVGQERLVLPAVRRSGMAHGAAICAIF